MDRPTPPSPPPQSDLSHLDQTLLSRGNELLARTGSNERAEVRRAINTIEKDLRELDNPVSFVSTRSFHEAQLRYAMVHGLWRLGRIDEADQQFEILKKMVVQTQDVSPKLSASLEARIERLKLLDGLGVEPAAEQAEDVEQMQGVEEAEWGSAAAQCTPQEAFETPVASQISAPSFFSPTTTPVSVKPKRYQPPTPTALTPRTGSPSGGLYLALPSEVDTPSVRRRLTPPLVDEVSPGGGKVLASKSDLQVVQFRVRVHAAPDEVIHVVGSCKELGAWQVERGLQLELQEASQEWTGTVLVDSSALTGSISYKLVRLSRDGPVRAVWERAMTGNRVLIGDISEVKIKWEE
ncbi:hypothetical protein JCM10908_001257 [Rhodotorula pacifica]|uniref:uncharacterized protein n=1 Tax=Rhodotorula pacifica TaxID=1495444 RepID=UPI00317AAD06